MTDPPRVCFIDIEVTPNIGYSYGRYETNVFEIELDWYIQCFSYKWEGDKKIYSYALPDFRGYRKNLDDDTSLVKKIHEVLSHADIVVAHNGDNFDLKKINARFLIHGFPVPKPIKTVDTLKILRRYFKLDSNKLDEACRQLKIGRKIRNEGGLWKRCRQGDTQAWKDYIKYNKHDVELLYELYMVLRPWIGNFPVTRIDTGLCLACGSDSFQKRGTRANAKHIYEQLQCNGCGKWRTGQVVKML